MLALDRALARELLGPFALALATFLGVLVLGISGFDAVRQAVALGLPWTLVLQTLWWRAPEALAFALPVACLAASLSAYTALQARGELTAWRSLGVSPWRLAAPALVLGACAGLGAAWAQAWVPEGLHRTRLAWAAASPGLGPTGGGEPVALAERRGGHLQRLAWVQPAPGGLGEVTVAELEGGRVVRLLQAKRAQRGATGWRFHQGWQATLGPEGLAHQGRFAHLEQALPEAADHLAQGERRPEELGAGAAWARLAALRASGVWGPQERAQAILWHQRWALPAVALAFALGGAAAALHGLQVGPGRGLGTTTLAVFAYYLLMFTANALGSSGGVPPWVAAWGPTCVALLAAVGLLAWPGLGAGPARMRS